MGNPTVFGFLRTYGLAFLVFVLIISGFVILGIINPIGYRADSCTVTLGFTCVEGTISAADDALHVRIVLGNDLESPVTINTSSLEVQTVLFETQDYCSFENESVSLEPEESVSITCIVPDDSVLSMAGKATIGAHFVYTSEASTLYRQASISLFTSIK